MLSSLSIYVGARDLNSSPPAYMIRTLLAEKFCQPPKCFLNKWMDLKVLKEDWKHGSGVTSQRKDLGSVIFVFSPIQFDHKTLKKPFLFIIKESFGIGWIINTYFNTENLESGFNIKWLLRWTIEWEAKYSTYFYVFPAHEWQFYLVFLWKSLIYPACSKLNWCLDTENNNMIWIQWLNIERVRLKGKQICELL